MTACYICYPTEFCENKIEICDLKGTFLFHPNIEKDAIIYKSSLYATI